ncbi:YybH family protein [Pseudidiomarina homiensis]|uniref:DUF4440 domain-containing protein n=1 Tax=Pseudidiomarina homiensis TaxID=364198 RepID=A0A432Y6Q3_9GAMM|nr:DUF4440 domain-containing protein [Pseudidiomarina homiensis]RUO56660.1 hypothetical protein CWI70_07995 [Pseudidiomarina homiensis]
MNTRRGLIGALMLFIAIPMSATAQQDPSEAVDQFRAALAAGKVDVISDILAKDVLIFEGSGVERSLAEYRSHHLPSDIKFSQHVTFELLERETRNAGEIAVVTSRYKVSGTYNEKTIDLTMNETVTAKKLDSLNWQIILIHWSN